MQVYTMTCLGDIPRAFATAISIFAAFESWSALKSAGTLLKVATTDIAMPDRGKGGMSGMSLNKRECRPSKAGLGFFEHLPTEKDMATQC